MLWLSLFTTTARELSGVTATIEKSSPARTLWVSCRVWLSMVLRALPFSLTTSGEGCSSTETLPANTREEITEDQPAVPVREARPMARFSSTLWWQRPGLMGRLTLTIALTCRFVLLCPRALARLSGLVLPRH
jgi:hypothetical protein